MSKLEELLMELCPEGVVYMPIWSITAWDKKFNAVAKEKQKTIVKYNYFLAADLKNFESENGTVKILTTSISDLWADEGKTADVLSEGEIVCIPWGGNPIVQYYKGKFITGDNRIATSLDVKRLSNKFLYYCMQNRLVDISSYYRGSGIKHPDMSKVLDLVIPVPPIEVQSEIVRILDNFAELTAELTEELTAELTARKDQYEYYREKLFDFKEYEVKNLSEVANIVDSLHATPNYVETGYSMIRVADVKGGYVDTNTTLKVDKSTYREFIKRYKPRFNDIIVSRVGSFGNFSLVPDEDVCLGQNVALIHPNINHKYLYYFLNSRYVSDYLARNARGGGYKNIGIRDILTIPIKVPSETEQKRVAKILERFDALCNDISDGIPAEIIAIDKQYEYYRGKLLSLKPMERNL